jgi:hypothetical protein
VGSSIRARFLIRSALEETLDQVESQARGVQIRPKPSKAWFMRSGRSLRREPYSRSEGSRRRSV